MRAPDELFSLFPLPFDTGIYLKPFFFIGNHKYIKKRKGASSHYIYALISGVFEVLFSYYL